MQRGRVRKCEEESEKAMDRGRERKLDGCKESYTFFKMLQKSSCEKCVIFLIVEKQLLMYFK